MLSLTGKKKEGEEDGVQGVICQGERNRTEVSEGILCLPVGIKRLGTRGHVGALSVGKPVSAAGRRRKSALCLL